MMSDVILALYGCSASGKTALAKRLGQDGFHKIKTDTTRPKRMPNEDDYHFMTKEQFKNTQTFAGTKFDGHYYGSDLGNVKQDLCRYHHLVIILTWSGIVDYCKEFRGTDVKVYPVEVYAQYSTIISRLNHRADAHITKHDIHERLAEYRSQEHQAHVSPINMYTVNNYPLSKTQGLRNEMNQVKKIIS